MTLNHLYVILTILSVSMTAISCSDGIDSTLPQHEEEAIFEYADEWSVTQNDIINVIDQMNPKGSSRALNYKISPLNDANGTTAAYAVNFGQNEGFVLINATKKYDPILAFAESGHFFTEKKHSDGLTNWINEQINHISSVDALPADTIAKFAKKWAYYCGHTSKKSLDKKESSRTSSSYNDEYAEAFDQYLQQRNKLISQGYEVFEPTDLSQDANNTIAQYVDAMTYPGYEDIRYQIYILAEKTEDKSTIINNFVKSTWTQENGYNMAFTNPNTGLLAPAGCATIAAGQIMRYYEYPEKYDWDAMPLNYATKTTSEFLRDLALTASQSFYLDNSGISPQNIHSAFQKFGYNVKLDSLSNEIVYQNLKNRKPVYLRGSMAGTYLGHAWIASGYKKELYHYKKELFILTWPRQYDGVLTYDVDSFFGSDYVYYNWGYNDGYDGFYKLSQCTSGDGADYSSERLMIYNIEPNK